MEQFISKTGLNKHASIQVELKSEDKGIWCGTCGNSDWYNLETMIEFRDKITQAIKELKARNDKETK